MISKFWWVNLLLGIALGFICVNTVLIWQEELVPLNPGKFEPSNKWPEPIAVKLPERNRDKYGAIASKNLYNSQRKEHLPKVEVNRPAANPAFHPEKKEKEPENKLPEEPEALEVLERADLILYGVVLMKGYRIALVNDLDEKNKGKQISVHEKDKLGGYTIEKILPADLIVTYNDKFYRVPLFKDEQSEEDTEKVTKPKDSKVSGIDKAEGAGSRSKILSTATSAEQENAAGVTANKKEEYEWVIMNTPFGKKRVRRKK